MCLLGCTFEPLLDIQNLTYKIIIFCTFSMSFNSHKNDVVKKSGAGRFHIAMVMVEDRQFCN